MIDIPARHDPHRFAVLQQEAHGAGHDYAVGSPHIRHEAVHSHVVGTLRGVVREVLDRRGTCRVLEVGAGHGTFTDHLVAAGAHVVVTEMSPASVAHLRERYRHDDRVEVVADPDGTGAAVTGGVDVVACLSVLHHIPDYLSAVDGWSRRITPGGAFVSFQDPLFYPRRSRLSLLGHRVAYLSWRLPRGGWRKGLSTAARRRRGTFDETNPSDMVEYHVVRDGVDELALVARLTPAFAEVGLQTYWSSQGLAAQIVGGLIGSPNTFGIVARDRRVAVPPPRSEAS